MTQSHLTELKPRKSKLIASKPTRPAQLRKLLTRKSGASLSSFKRHSAGNRTRSGRDIGATQNRMHSIANRYRLRIGVSDC